MAIRSVILWFGDKSIAANRPVSELTAYNPAFDDVQSDSRIWDIQDQAWELLAPGGNTDTVSPASDKWGPEVRARPALALLGHAGGFIDHIKVAVPNSTLTFVDQRRNADGTAAGGILRPCWSPEARDLTGYCKMIAQVKAAAAAAQTLGDTICIRQVVISIYLDEVLLGKGAYSYFERMVDLIDSLRVDLATLPFVSIGSFRNASTDLEVTIIAPHAEWNPALSEPQKGAITSIRTQLDRLASPNTKISVHTTYNLTCTDNLNFDTASLVVLGEEIVKSFVDAAAPNDAGLPTADMVMVLGDSIPDGSGAAPHPAHLTGAQSNINIWARDACEWQPAQIGVNNLISFPSAFNLMGVEMPLGHLLRAEYGAVWMLKATMIGSHAAPFHEKNLYSFGPLGDPYTYDWHPASRGGMCDLTLSWFRRTVEALRKAGKAPRLRTIYICLGANDLILPVDITKPIEYLQVVKSLKMLVARIKEKAAAMLVNTTDLRVVISLPTTRIGSPLAPWADGKTAELRAEMLEWCQEDLTVRAVDMNPFATNDGLHLSTAGTVDFAKAWFQAATAPDTTSVQPLFVPSKAELRKALRLSQVADENDAVHQIDEAIRASRVKIFQALGQTRVDQILTTPYVQRPATQSDYMRMLASTVETKMVRAELMRVMPLMFMDGANTVQAWQQEAAFREGSFLQTRDELRRLEADIAEGLTMLLTGSVVSGDPQISTLFPDTYRAPGDSLASEVF